jgi:hypothetical protein
MHLAARGATIQIADRLTNTRWNVGMLSLLHYVNCLKAYTGLKLLKFKLGTYERQAGYGNVPIDSLIRPKLKDGMWQCSGKLVNANLK